MQRVRRIVGILAGSVAMTIGLAAQNPVAPAPPAGPGGFQQAAPKNLKVLPKTWTGQQVRAVMQTFAESLGVQCTHCHADNHDWAAEKIGEKDATREMVTLTKKINDTFFKGEPVVTCWGCHRGQAVPDRTQPPRK